MTQVFYSMPKWLTHLSVLCKVLNIKKGVTMKKWLAIGVFAVSGAAMAAEDAAQVVWTRPRMVTAYQQECYMADVTTDNSGVGTVVGSVAGGIIGHQVGDGRGRDAATVVGALVGAGVGKRIGRDQINVEQRQVCNTVPVQRQVGETVMFEYRGRRFVVNF